MKRTIEILRRMRATVLLLTVLLTSLSAHAELTCIASPSDCGTVKAEETLVYVTPAAGYYISAVTYNGTGPNIALQ